MTPPLDRPALQARLHRDGFAFVTAEHMRQLLPMPEMDDWPAFRASWNDLAPDTYLAAVGRHRSRRHATFAIEPDGTLQRQPHQPHWQSARYNSLQGDIQRWFLPIRPALAGGASMRSILQFAHALFAPMAAGVPHHWHVETHQFRIEARAGEPGEPTPEGVHHDGVDYVLVLLIDRQNIESGTTTIHADDGALLGSFTLAHPLDAAMVIDARVSHGVTAVTPIDPAQPAHRDVLVVTFRATPPAATSPA
ncbi:MAG: 2OG-Fe dioxygenase family protein [Rhodanobacter lindaniclasticus]